MTPHAPVLSIRNTGPAANRHQLYRQLARALGTAPGPAGVVLEQTDREGSPRLIVRPPALGALLDGPATPSSWDAGTEGVPSFEPPLGFPSRRGVIVVGSGDDRPAAQDPRRTGTDGMEWPRLGSTWIGVQTYWLARPAGGIWVARRFCVAAPDRRAADEIFSVAGLRLARHWSEILGVRARPSPVPGWFGRRDWRRRTVRSIPRAAWSVVSPDTASSAAELPGPTASADRFDWERGHFCAFGASGAGKTTFLAAVAAEAVRRGRSVVVLDLHGDLAPAIAGRLDRTSAQRLVAIDAGARPVPGIDVLARGAPGNQDRAAAHFVAALKRLTPDGEALYWGFRLERIFDTFVRLTQEEGGSIVDLADLLANPDRRDAARLATARPELAAFLEELGPLVKRHPEFLWSAATRLSKIVLVPELRELLAPRGESVPVEALVREGRSLLIRLPLAELGPEAAALAGTLLLARIYLGLAADRPVGCGTPPVLFVLDEAHGFSPALVAEILTEGRKFGVRAALATQFPARFAREVADAARGAVGTHVSFRVPRSDAPGTARWLGLGAPDASERLATLPIGEGILVGPETDAFGSSLAASRPPAENAGAWPAALERTRAAFDVPSAPVAPEPSRDPACERLMLAVLASNEEGHPLPAESAQLRAAELPGEPVDPAQLRDRWSDLRRRGWVQEDEDGARLTPSGARALGLGTPTGASRESAEHRALLVEAFRIFARRGYRLEIVRQGRFDTTLPDARLNLLPPTALGLPPAELAERIARAQQGWAWRCFGGRNVAVEAEVSGALRPARIRHGIAKAARQGAFVLFLVPDPARARRVRAVLRAENLGTARAQVWTLRLGEALGNAARNR